MNSKELGTKYDQIAKWWSKEIGNSKYGIKYLKRSINLVNKGSNALDIGCGEGRFLEILSNHFHVVGIDVSAEMIKIARERHPQTTLINEDFYNWQTEEKFDLVIAWDSVFHASKKLQRPIVMKMCELLSKEGVLLFTAGGVEGEVDGTVNGVKFEYASLSYKSYLDLLEEMNCQVILMERDQYPLDHIVFICKKLKG